MRRDCFLFTLTALVALTWPTVSRANEPSLTGVSPPGGQRGTEFELQLTGANLKTAEEVLLYHPGVEVVRVEPVNEFRVKLRLKAAAGCRLGEHALRLRTRFGVSELRTFYVGPFPCVEEKEPNNDPKRANSLPLNVTVSGTIDRGDVDYFRVELKKGQRLAVEVEGMRLGAALFDPQVAVLDANGKVLADADDTPLLRHDPHLTVLAPADGTYLIRLRETIGSNTDGGKYRLHVGTFPRPAVVFPAGGQAGTEATVRFLGDAAGAFTRKFRLPAWPEPRFGLLPESDGLPAPSPNPFRVSPFLGYEEREPNNDVATATAAAGPPPLAFDGMIATPGDVDHFRFRAKRGIAYDVQVYATRLGSPLDPVLTLLDASGKVLAKNADTKDRDCWIRFVSPADGDYVLRVADQTGAGGPLFVYRVEVAPALPGLTVFQPQPVRESQERRVIVVPRGNRFTTYLGVRRTGFDGPVSLSAEGLPAGVRMIAGPVEAGQYLVPVVFEAAADAPISGKLVSVKGTAAVGSEKIAGSFRQTIDLVHGTADTLYHSITVDRLAVAVVEEVPFEVRLIEPTAPLVPDGALGLKVVARRKPGFKEAITVTLPFLPPWVEAPAQIVIPEGASEAVYPLTAAPETSVRTWDMVAEARASVGASLGWVSSPFVKLRVESPFVKGSIPPVLGEQGQTVKVVVRLDQRVPIAGRVKARLLRLPPRVKAADVTISAETKEIVFTAEIDKTSPVGLHKEMHCQIAIVKDGYEVVHLLGRPATFRIEAPGGVVLDANGRPLSRLEILRLQNEQKKNQKP
jgi:hypothetical protein